MTSRKRKAASSNRTREGYLLVQPPRFRLDEMSAAMTYLDDHGFVVMQSDVDTARLRQLLLQDLWALCPEARGKDWSQLHHGHLANHNTGLMTLVGRARRVINQEVTLHHIMRHACAAMARDTAYAFDASQSQTLPPNTNYMPQSESKSNSQLEPESQPDVTPVTKQPLLEKSQSTGSQASLTQQFQPQPMLSNWDGTVAMSLLDNAKTIKTLPPHVVVRFREHKAAADDVEAAKPPTVQGVLALMDLDEYAQSNVLVPGSHHYIRDVQSRMLSDKTCKPKPKAKSTDQLFLFGWNTPIPEACHNRVRNITMQIQMKEGDALLLHRVIHTSGRGKQLPKGTFKLKSEGTNTTCTTNTLGTRFARIAMPFSMAPKAWASRLDTEAERCKRLAMYFAPHGTTHAPVPTLYAADSLNTSRQASKQDAPCEYVPLAHALHPDLTQDVLDAILKDTPHADTSMDVLHQLPHAFFATLPEAALRALVPADVQAALVDGIGSSIH